MDVLRRVGRFLTSSNSNLSTEPVDETLRSCRSQMLALQERILNIRTQFIQYGDVAMRSCECSALLSKSMSQFNRNPAAQEEDNKRSSAAQTSAKVYSIGQDSVANRVVSIFHDEIDGSNGVVSQLDEWIDVTKQICQEIQAAEQLRAAAETAAKRLQTFESRRGSHGAELRRGSLFGDDRRDSEGLSDLELRIQETEQARKHFTLEFETTRSEVLDHVHSVMEKRDEIFERIYVQILQCQATFYRETSQLLQDYEPIIASYQAKRATKRRSITSAILEKRRSSRSTPPANKPPPPPFQNDLKPQPLDNGDSVLIDLEIPKELPQLPSEPVVVVSEEPSVSNQSQAQPQEVPVDDLLNLLDIGTFSPTSTTTPIVDEEKETTQSPPPDLHDPFGFFDAGARDGGASAMDDLLHFPTTEDQRQPQPGPDVTPEPSPMPMPHVADEKSDEEIGQEVERLLSAWEYNDGRRRRNIRALLSTLDSLTFERSKWKPVTMSDLLSEERLGKAYRKSISKFHPDKISEARGFDLKQCLLAKGIFLALTSAWRAHEDTQG